MLAHGPVDPERARWFGRIASSGGFTVLHTSIATGQRGWNLQPGGNSDGFGTLPGITLRRAAISPSTGIEPRRPAVYGMRGWWKISSTSAYSTTWPAYMTATRSQVSATTPRSCVMTTTAVSNSLCRRSISSRICAWTVTSSAVVGSSAISSFGSLASAIAIIARWRMPPENSCG